MGYTGLLTLAHAGYFAFGSYVYALISLLLGWEFIPSSLIAILLTVLLSGMLSIASWRLRGDFFILFSLTIQVVFFTVLKNWHDPTQPVGSWGNMTNGGPLQLLIQARRRPRDRHDINRGVPAKRRRQRRHAVEALLAIEEPSPFPAALDILAKRRLGVDRPFR